MNTPKNATECSALLNRWDTDQSIWSIEMGGLGPGYEQAIQQMAVEFTRASVATDTPDEEDKVIKEFRARCDEVMRVLDDKLGGVTGAMFGAATNLAYHWLYGKGPEGVLADVPSERRIQVSKNFPQTGESK